MKTPAEVVIGLFGVRPLARQLGLSPGAVSKWRDNGGQIPIKHHQQLLMLARARHRRLTAGMLIFGRAA